MKYVEFYLTKPSTGGTLSRELNNGQYIPVAFPPTYAIPSFAKVTDDRPNSKTKGRPTTIRYYEGEPSIWTDEQSEKWSLTEYKIGNIRCTPIVFLDGKLRVREDNETLLEFLRKHRMNQDKAQQYGHTGRGFFEYRPQRLAEENLKRTEEAFTIETAIRAMGTDQLQEVARVTNIVDNYRNMFNTPPSEIKWELIARVRGSEPKVIKEISDIIKDPLTSIKADILHAVDVNQLMWGGIGGETLMVSSTGNVICKAPAGEDKIHFCARYINEKSPQTLSIIRGYIGKTTEDTEDFDGYTKEQVIDQMVEYHKEHKNLFDGNAGADVKYKDHPLVGKTKKGYEGAKQYLIDSINYEIFAEIYKDYKQKALTTA